MPSIVSSVLFALAGQASTGQAMPPPISTDRPTFSDSSSLSGLGFWQIESGSTFTEAGGQSVTTLGEFILRRQVSANVELRLVNLGLAFPSQTRGGSLEDPAIGFKYRFLTGTSRRPELTLIGLTSLPIGAPNFRTSAFAPTAKLAWTQSLGPIWALAGNFVYSRAGAPGEGFDQWAAGAFLTEALSAKTSLFYDIYSVNTEGPGTSGAAFIDAGVLQLVTNDCQIDARIGIGLNERAEGWFFGAGVSWRF